MPTRTPLLLGFAALALAAAPAAAQSSGGLSVGMASGEGIALAQAITMTPRLPTFAPLRPVAQPGSTLRNPAVSRREVNRQAIAKVRGDAGFLEGFQFGQPLAPSRQKPLPPVVPEFTFIDAPFIVNNFDSSLNFTFGDGNVTGQQTEEAPPAFTEGGVSEGGSPEPAGPQDTSTETNVAVSPPADPNAPQPDPLFGGADPLLGTAGPLAHLPFALATGGVVFNNIGANTNTVQGSGNVAIQQITRSPGAPSRR